MSRPSNKGRITKAVSIDSQLARWAEKQAASENRSLSNFVETVLRALKSAEETKKTEPVSA